MTFTASDIDSLSRSLAHWECGEYVSEAFVIIACVGEWIADLERSWLTDERKKHLQHRSTILLIAALSASLLCLIKTNDLSGAVIESLGDKAELAEGKAKEAVKTSSNALSLSNEALSKAGDAKVAADGAADSASRAQTSAGIALDNAKYADLVASKATSNIRKVASTLDDTAWSLNDRHLRDFAAFKEELSKVPKGTAEVWYVPNEPEAEVFAFEIAGLLPMSGWTSGESRPLPIDSQPHTVFVAKDAPLLDRLRAEANSSGLALPLLSAINRGGRLLAPTSSLETESSLPENRFVIVVGKHSFHLIPLPLEWTTPDRTPKKPMRENIRKSTIKIAH